MRARQPLPTGSESEESPVSAPPRHDRNGNGNGEPCIRHEPVLDPVALYACDASGVIQYFNGRAAELWGRRPETGDTNERFCGAYMLFRPDGSHIPHENCPMADVLSGRVSGVYDAEVQIERPDGTRVIVIVNIVPLMKDGHIEGAANSFYDVSDRSYVEGMHKRASQDLVITAS